MLFDEFHERSLDADLGLALALDAQGGLREDLRLLVMSATLDGARVAKLMGDAPVIRSEGRAYRSRPAISGAIRPPHRGTGRRGCPEGAAGRARLDSRLPAGPGEIRRVETLLRERITDPPSTSRRSMARSTAASRTALIAPAPPGRRKVVLATSIAETSLTIEGVRVVIDSGLARVPVYEPDLGLTRLETVRVSAPPPTSAAGPRRANRAGHLLPPVGGGRDRGAGAVRPPRDPVRGSCPAPPRLRRLGRRRPDTLAFLDPPPAPAVKEARALLRDLDALDDDGRITAIGHRLRALPLPPRLAKMVTGRGGTGRTAARGGRTGRGPRRARPGRRCRRLERAHRTVPPRPLPARRGHAPHGAGLAAAGGARGGGGA